MPRLTCIDSPWLIECTALEKLARKIICGTFAFAPLSAVLTREKLANGFRGFSLMASSATRQKSLINLKKSVFHPSSSRHPDLQFQLAQPPSSSDHYHSGPALWLPKSTFKFFFSFAPFCSVEIMVKTRKGLRWKSFLNRGRECVFFASSSPKTQKLDDDGEE